jgi:hypothetical protein
MISPLENGSAVKSVLKNWDRHLATAVSPEVRAMRFGASPIFQRAVILDFTEGDYTQIPLAAILPSQDSLDELKLQTGRRFRRMTARLIFVCFAESQRHDCR